MKKGSIEEGLVYHAGFPNAAEDQRFDALSLDKLVVQHRTSTFFWRLESDVPELHWRAGTIVVVDRALPPHSEGLVVAVVQDVFTLCRIHKQGFRRLNGELVTEESQLWGIVTFALQTVRNA